MEQSLWNTFDIVRPLLDAQYDNRRCDPGTGLSVEELRQETERYLATHQGEPLIRTRAALFELLLLKGRIDVDPFDWFADHLETGRILYEYRSRWFQEAYSRLSAEDRRDAEAGVRCGAFQADLDLTHTSPDWESILELGPCGLRDRALAALEKAACDREREFLRAAARCYEAMRLFILRLAELAQRKNCVRVIGALRAIAERPPETLQEAFQLAYIYHELQEIEGEPVRSMGCFDRLFVKFYLHDLEKGILTRDQAKELLKFYWFKFYARTHGNEAGKNFCLGGMLPDGGDAVNELTFLACEAYHEMRVYNPKLSMRMFRGSSDAILRRVAAYMRDGMTSTVFINDDTAFPMFLKRGKDPLDVYNYIPIGCYEPAIMGREMCCSMSALINLVKPVELALNGGIDPLTGERIGPPAAGTIRSFDDFFAEYRRQLGVMIDRALRIAATRSAFWPEVNPSPLLSGSMRDCIASRRDVSEFGTRYNTSGVMCAGIGSAADSLTAVRVLVFERKLCTLDELNRALAADWQGYEELREEALRGVPTWGNNLPLPDGIAVETAAFAAGRTNHTPNGKGATFQMGLWSIDHCRRYGEKTGALPDGRRAREVLSKNLDASIGMDRRGTTALIHSAGKLDHTEFPDGSVLDVMLHPSALTGEDGDAVIPALVRTYFENGGFAVHFNIFDAGTLRQAQREPEKFSELQVRVCGWSVRFIDLAPEDQELFIRDAEKEDL